MPLLTRFKYSSLHLLSTSFRNRFVSWLCDSASKRTTPSADRNSQPIAAALRIHLNRDIKNMQMLEIASGTGQHVGYLAPLFPNIFFQPTDNDPVNLTSIKAYADDCFTDNIREPLLIDVTVHPKNWSTQFNPASFDYMLNINMVHIAPFNAAVGLFQAAGYLLKPQGKLFTYGPYAVNGVLEPHSNVLFNESLRTRNPEWGVRDISELECLAKANRMKMSAKANMPANNKLLIWTKL